MTPDEMIEALDTPWTVTKQEIIEVVSSLASEVLRLQQELAALKEDKE